MIRILATSGLMVLAAGLIAGCSSYPTPVQHMADAEAATRTARDQGASADPKGQLHVKMAEEEINRAKQLIASGDNETADFVLVRAKSDADLAIAEAQDSVAQREAQKASQDVADLRARSASSTTTTTSATVTPAIIAPAAPLPGASTTTTTTSTTMGGPK